MAGMERKNNLQAKLELYQSAEVLNGSKISCHIDPLGTEHHHDY